MRRIVLLTAVSMFFAPLGSWCRQTNQPSPPQGQSQSAAALQQDSLAEAARKAREQRKQAAKSTTVFTNDNLPEQGGISTVGQGASSPSSNSASASASAPAGQKASETAKPASDEKTWREKFARLRHTLEQDEANLAVMQRELGVLNTQYYNDPVKGMQQGLTRADIDNKTAEIDKMKAQIESDQQAISDAEDQLRKSGGDPGWAR